jgi:hypothetical protein
VSCIWAHDSVSQSNAIIGKFILHQEKDEQTERKDGTIDGHIMKTSIR